MSGIIEIDDMPDLGNVTDGSQFVGEKAGSGLFSATALRGYIYQGPMTVPATIAVQAVGAGSPQFALLDSGAVGKGTFYWDQPSNSVNVASLQGTYASNLQLTATGDFVVTGSGYAYKAGGGTWSAISDARIKTVQGNYEDGLAKLLQLQPVTYRYRANCGIQDTSRSHVGMIAQDVQPVLPDMVRTTRGTIDGQPVTDMLALDTSNLQYVMLNAIRELEARVVALEGAA